MISSGQMKAARALLGIDQRQLAHLCKVSLPTIQRMEASAGTVRGTIDSLMKIVQALDSAGIELIGESSTSVGRGRGVRLKEEATPQKGANTRTGRKSTGTKARGHLTQRIR